MAEIIEIVVDYQGVIFYLNSSDYKYIATNGDGKVHVYRYVPTYDPRQREWKSKDSSSAYVGDVLNMDPKNSLEEIR